MATVNLAALSPSHQARPPLGSTNQKAAGHADGGRTKAEGWLVTHTHSDTHMIFIWMLRFLMNINRPEETAANTHTFKQRQANTLNN